MTVHNLTLTQDELDMIVNALDLRASRARGAAQALINAPDRFAARYVNHKKTAAAAEGLAHELRYLAYGDEGASA